MASLDLSDLQNALAGESRQPNNRAVKQYLLDKGVSEPIARATSMNELCYWTEKELDDVFNDLDVLPGAVLGKLLSFHVQGSIDSANFVKPTLEDIEDSARKLGALCVNRQGQFCTNPREGFAALSHVWSQGLGADDDNRGLHKSLLEQIFEKVEGLGVRWIWTDSLAIPGGKRALTLLEEELKGKLINAMADIYRKATYVIIFDALCLRLNSVDPIKAAVVNSLGNWMTRMWTYQEIKLATNTYIATKSGFVSFNSIVECLKSYAFIEAGEEYDTDAPGKYPSFARTFNRLQRNDAIGISLPDVAIGCGYRDAGDRLDYARALFPTLGVEWKANLDIQQAMHKLYITQKRHATRLVLWHGPPRASIPGWAPSVFNGLVDCKITEPAIWKPRGIQREWMATKVLSIIPSKPDRLVLALESDSAERALSVGFVSEQTQRDSPESVELFRKAVREGNAYLLADEPLIPKRHFSRVGLLVERFTKANDLEAWVCLTLAVGETEEMYKAETTKWLLLHENPVSTELLSGKQTTELHYMMTQSTRPDATPDLAQMPLHKAVVDDNVDDCRRHLAHMDVNMVDSRGWTALHVAAAAGNSAFFPILIEAGANLDAFDMNGQSPLSLAVDNGHIDAMIELIKAGANVNASHKNGWSPLCTAVRRGSLEMTKLLLESGADPSARDAGGWTPLQFAIDDDDTENAVLDILLEAHADPNVPSQGILTPLDIAARKGNASAIRKLLSHNADPNVSVRSQDPPLYHAIASGNSATVRALVEGGAKCTVRFKDEWTPMMVAAKQGDHEIGRLLQSRGASLDDCDGEGLTPLHIAAMNGSRVFYKWLKEAGAKQDVRNARGRTPASVCNGF